MEKNRVGNIFEFIWEFVMGLMWYYKLVGKGWVIFNLLIGSGEMDYYIKKNRLVYYFKYI